MKNKNALCLKKKDDPITLARDEITWDDFG